MFKFFTLSLSLSLAILTVNGTAQEKVNVKFGKISLSDFNVTSPLIDSNANAVLIADIGSSDFEGNKEGWFSLVYKRYKRIKILNKNGFDAATIEIHLYSNGKQSEKVDDIKAITSNEENGSVVQTKLEKGNVFQDKINKNWITKKFTLPAVKEGSIIEIAYTIKSDFLFNLQPWSFQGPYPCLWSEYRVDLPGIFNYVYMKQGINIPFYLNTKEEKSKVYTVEQPMENAYGNTRRLNVNASVTSTKWVMKDVPALKEEPFTSNINNYAASIKFQLSQYRLPDQPVEDKMGNWNTVSAEFLKRDDFGMALNGDNSWLNNSILQITQGVTSKTDKAKKIYEFVRDNFTCTSDEGIFLSDGVSLKDVYKKKAGNVADINMLLIAMLRHAGLKAEPIILSTKSNGFVHESYPLVSEYNYLLCEVMLDENFYLDASNSLLGFGKLSPQCYNGKLQEISLNPASIPFTADQLKEKKNILVSIINSDNGMKGSYNSLLGYNASLEMRKQLQKVNEKEVLKSVEYQFTSDMKFENEAIESAKELDKPLSIKYDFSFNKGENDILYFTPMIGEVIKENPFKSLERLYPVELPYCIDETYALNLEIPKGYTVDELPQSLRISIEGGLGGFEYSISKTDAGIQMRTRLQLNKTMFDATDYETLRSFYAAVVKKENEQIVFKKLK